MSSKGGRDLERQILVGVGGCLGQVIGMLLEGLILLIARYPKVMLPLIAVIVGFVVVSRYGLPLQIWPAPQPAARGVQNIVVAATGTPKVLVATKPPANNPAELTGIATTDKLNVRSGPGTNETVIGKLSKDDKVTVLGRNDTNEWLTISYNGGTGWVAAKYIALQVSITDVPLVAAHTTPAPSSSTASPRSGMWIMDVEPGSEAADAGFRKGQILISLNGQGIEKAQAATELVARNIGSPITAVLWEDGREITVTITPKDKFIGVTLCQLDRCPQGRYP